MNIPASTYRLQLNKDFTFTQVDEIIEYLEKLGITTLYAAPIFEATPGSNHGYDVSDPHKINAEIGTENELVAISKKLREKGMSWLQDIVPNHMAYAPQNKRLMDVLERGPDSPYYKYFDVDWNHPDKRFRHKLLVPFLGSNLEEAVSNGEVLLHFQDGNFCVKSGTTLYPLSAVTYEKIAQRMAGLSEFSHSLKTYLFGFYPLAAQKLPLSEWEDQKNTLKDSTGSSNAEIADLLLAINKNHSLLLELLNEQYYVLANWRVTESLISFRRFFTVNSLICLAMQEEEVFNDYHQYIIDLYQKGIIQGLRIDHIDGLQNPKAYIDELRKAVGDDCYIIAEKILEADEQIPTDWQLEGTSGYEFLAMVSQLLTNREGAQHLLHYYHELSSGEIDYHALVFRKKQLILEQSMQGELDNLMTLARELELLPIDEESEPRIREALGIFLASFPVYRIYPDTYPIQNIEFVEEAFKYSLSEASHLEKEFEMIQSLFNNDHVSTEESENRIYFLKRMMQYTGPLAAKGVEDTTFYLYNPLISHNEVGDSPSALGIPIQDFHEKMSARQTANPLSINATSTHDTKRGEDARLRINVLSELSAEWIDFVSQWRQQSSSLKTVVAGNEVPSTNEEYFIYQAIIGGYPEDLKITGEFIERLKTYMNKVLREAKEHTGWAEPNIAYEDAISSFIDRLLSNSSGFITSLQPLIRKIIEYASVYSLAQVLIKITAPGIPDIYQGCELWDLSFVDPDNRRAVDYEKRIAMLDQLQGIKPGSEEWRKYLHSKNIEGAVKLFVTYKALNFRKDNQTLFTQGEYIPLQDSAGSNLLAYARKLDQEWVTVILPLGLVERDRSAQFKGDMIRVPEGFPVHWENVLTGEEHNLMHDISVEELTKEFPVVFLRSKNQK